MSSRGCAISEEEALESERARHAALLLRDVESLGRLLGDELVYIHSNGIEDDKTAIIEAQRVGKVRYRRIRPEVRQIRTFDRIAIISGSMYVEVNVSGEDLFLHLKFHSVWVKRTQGQLEFVSWQATRIPG